jgi:hypothetical protein
MCEELFTPIMLMPYMFYYGYHYAHNMTMKKDNILNFKMDQWDNFVGLLSIKQVNKKIKKETCAD